MDRAEKLISAKFFAPERRKQMRMTDDGVRIDVPARKRLSRSQLLGICLAGLALSTGMYSILYTQGIVAHPKLQLLIAVNFLESLFRHI